MTDKGPKNTAKNAASQETPTARERKEATGQMTRHQKKREDDAFTQGYVCAVANLIILHDQPTMAKDVLRAVTPVDWKIIDEYDRDTLAKAGLAPRRRKRSQDAREGS